MKVEIKYQKPKGMSIDEFRKVVADGVNKATFQLVDEPDDIDIEVEFTLKVTK